MRQYRDKLRKKIYAFCNLRRIVKSSSEKIKISALISPIKG
jgi:hypothetical protein